MSETILTHDAGVSAFEDAGGVVQTSDDDEVSFDWDEQHVVTVDAPSDLEGAFDTDQFYKIEGATIARPIKQPYLVGDSIDWYKKPAEELERAAWSFDNAPFTLGHPDTGMVKNVDDIHGFWRSPRYDSDDDRLKEDLYVPTSDEEALDWLEEHSDVSVGFYNRVAGEYGGDTGDLTDDDVDGFQIDMFGNHIAGVEQGRCSGEDGCGLDDQSHGQVLVDAETPDAVHEQHDEARDDGGDASGNEDCSPCETTMGDTNPNDDEPEESNDGFDVPDLSVDAVAEKNDEVQEVVEERDSLREDLDEMDTEIRDALDGAEHFSVELDEDECPCEAVEDLVSDLDSKAEEVEDLTDELSEYRAEEKEEALDTLTDLGADREEWEDEGLDAIEEEVERREEVLEATDADVSVKDIDSSTDSEPEGGDDDNRTMSGTRTFGRGHGA